MQIVARIDPRDLDEDDAFGQPLLTDEDVAPNGDDLEEDDEE